MYTLHPEQGFVKASSLRSHSWLVGVLVKILWLGALLECWYTVTAWMDPILYRWG